MDGYSLNSPIAFELDNGVEKFAYKGKIAGAFANGDSYLVMPEEVYQNLHSKGSSYAYIWIDCEQNDIASVEKNIQMLLSDISHVKMKAYQKELQAVQAPSRVLNMGCYLFMAIVGLIGFMNLANTMIINITTKKQEYGVLQAVGMTNRQLNASLQIQGFIFTLGTVCTSLIVGLPLGYFLFSYAKHNRLFGMNVYHIPVVPILVMILLIGTLQVILSFVLSHNLKKETLVERIRYQE